MRVLLLLLTALNIASAADFAGKWEYAYTSPNGIPREGVMELTIDGGKVAGSLTSDRGKMMIEDGTVQGDNITFRVVRKAIYDEIIVRYEGKLQGGTLKLTMQYGTHQPVSITGKKAL